jgi:hypothetical protein
VIQRFTERASKDETLMSDERDEIKNVVAQLKRLQVQESELLQRLERLRLSEAERQPAASPTPTWDFRICDLVKIKNPNRLQIREGIVTRTGAGADRVTAQSRNGSSKVVRASFNLTRADQLTESTPQDHHG